MTEIEAQSDRRAQRRADRQAQSRTEILDAAEKVFGEDGIHDGSLRKIALISGFSTASIYLFFANKQHLLSETLTRRGDELIAVMRGVEMSELRPIEKLHRVVDACVEFFEERPQFRLLMRHIRGGATINGSALAEFADPVDSRFQEAMMVVTSIIEEGQRAGDIRAGNGRILAQLYSVLVNEFILLDVCLGEADTEFTAEEFHGLIQAAFQDGGR
ncbi:MAG: TetR/AcrR family transcriptional regulator [Acidimicrobiales bacterium]|jgi:AcrR family transcriptional regulator